MSFSVLARSFIGSLLAACLLAGSALADTTMVSSFDGTKIHVNFFPAPGLKPGHRAPTVMLGPGWSSPGDTNENDSTDTSTGIPGVGTLQRAGFNVLTWDPRGFGSSGGTVEVDSPHFEARDVSAMISWLATQPQSKLDHRGDPRVGMAGGSYGGGIQLVSAPTDRRIDAIVPDISWHSLVTSLYMQQTVKLGWSTHLYLLGKSAGRLDPRIGNAYQRGVAGEPLTRQDISFFRSRGPGALVRHIHIPTLLIQGTVDNLFTLQEAVTNYGILRRAGVPVKMLWFCGGHGICLTKPGNTSLIDKETIAWLGRYLARRRHVKTGSTFEWTDQNGIEHTASDYPLAGGSPIVAHGSGTLPLMQAGGSGPVSPPPGASATATIAAPITPAQATNAVNVLIPDQHATRYVVGAPRLTVTYSGAGSGESGASTRVYAQVVDNATGKVLGNQITPVPIKLDGSRHTFTEPLEVLSATYAPGENFTLQLTASTVAYQAQRASGAVTFSRIAISLPTVNLHAKPPGYGSVAPNGCTNGGTVKLRLPTGTRSAAAFLGGKKIAHGRHSLTIHLIGRGLRTVRVRIVIHRASGTTSVRSRRLHACP